MSVPDVPPTPPRQSRSAVATAILLIAGLVLLAPGLCAAIFIQDSISTPSPIPGQFITLWIISFMISAVGIAMIVYTFRR
jgi:hypothetical protein